MKSGFDEELKAIELRIMKLDERFAQQGARMSEIRKTVATLRDEITLIHKQIELRPVRRTMQENRVASFPQPSSPATGSEQLTTRPLSAEELYEQAYSHFMERTYDDAIAGFTEYVERFSTSDLADNAQFWIGESNLLLQRYEEAFQAFQLVLEKFPKGNKIPDALFKKGYALFQLGQHDAALAELDVLIERFPASSKASRARKLVERIAADR